MTPPLCVAKGTRRWRRLPLDAKLAQLSDPPGAVLEHLGEAALMRQGVRQSTPRFSRPLRDVDRLLAERKRALDALAFGDQLTHARGQLALALGEAAV